MWRAFRLHPFVWACRPWRAGGRKHPRLFRSALHRCGGAESGGHYPLWLFEGATNTLAFETYVEHVLVPTLQPGDWVFIDNLSAHQRDWIRQRIAACGAQLHFLPPYSPDWNPIELCWAKVKAVLRQVKARTFDALVEALADALRAIRPTDAFAWFAHCGYAVYP